MRRTAIITSLLAEVMRRIRHFGDFVIVPLAIVIFVDLAGMYRLYLVLVGVAAWTLLEYLVHRIVFHRYSVGRRLHQLHHDHPNDPDAERSSLSTPLIASPTGFLLIVTAGVEDGSAIFAGLLLGYLAFIVVHYAGRLPDQTVLRCGLIPRRQFAKRPKLVQHRFEIMRFHFNCHASPVNCFNLDRGTVPTNVGGQQIVHRDIPRKRGGYVTSSPKFG